ncbi:MAG: ATP-binding protein [Flavobacteriales bacterium]
MKILLKVIFAFLLSSSISTGYSQRYKFNSFTEINGLPSNSIQSLAQDATGYLWIGTDKGLSRFDGSSFVNYKKYNGLFDDNIEKIIVDRENNIYVFHPNTPKVTKLKVDNTFEILDSIPLIYPMSDSITRDRCKLINKRKIKVSLSSSFTLSKENGLPNDLINDVFIDREDILWIACQEKGLYALYLENFPLFPWNDNNEMKFNYSLGGGLQLVTFKNSVQKMKIENEKPVFSTIFKSPYKDLNCAVLLEQKELIYGTNNGMYLHSFESNREIPFKELVGKSITVIEKHYNGDIIIIADGQLYKYVVYKNEVRKVKELKNFKATSIKKINGRVYVLGKGNIYHIEKRRFTSIFAKNQNIAKIDFVHISQGNSKSFWISSSNKGLFNYDVKEKTIESFNRDNSFPYSSIQSVSQNDEYLWVTNNKRVILYNLEDKTYSFYGKNYLENTDFLSFSFKHRNATFLFSKQGLIRTFNPENFVKKSPNLSLIEILISGKSVPIDSVLNIGHSIMPIEFTYQSISLKDKIYYQYQLDGYNNKWSKPTLSSSITYDNVSKGEYVFRVRTYDPINKVTLENIEKRFAVLPPFWQTSSFISALVLIIGITILSFYLFRVWRLKKQTEKLETMVNEKTYVLTAQNQNIEQFSYSLSHDLKNPINNIKGLVEIMEGAPAEDQGEIRKMLMNSAILLEEKIKSTLNTIKQMQAKKKHSELLNFEELFVNVKQSLLLLINENDVKFNIDFKAKKVIYNASILESVFYNLISNSIKYGPVDKQIEISISTKKDNDKIVLIFEDNGIGFDMDRDMDKVFSIFERVNENDHTTGTGIGLYMVKQMIELNGGIMSVDSVVNEGTKFTIRLNKLEGN